MIHPITTLFDQSDERSYWVYGKLTALFLNKSNKIETSPTPEQKAKLASLENGDVFECRIIGIPKKQSHFIVVLPLLFLACFNKITQVFYSFLCTMK